MRQAEKMKTVLVTQYNVREQRGEEKLLTGRRYSFFLPPSGRYRGSGALFVACGGLSSAEWSLFCETTCGQDNV